MRQRDYLVEVCSACYRASCWHGDNYCEKYRASGVIKKPASELRKLRLEPQGKYSPDNLRTVTGNQPEWIL